MRGKTLGMILPLVAAVLVRVGPVMAQQAPETPGTEDVVAPREEAVPDGAQAAGEGPLTEAPGTNWLLQIFGPGIWPLWICSVVLVALMLERRRALRPETILDPAMIERVADLMGERKLDAARKTAEDSETVLGKAWAQGLHEFSLGGSALAETLTNATFLAFKPLRKNLLALATIGVVSPLFGLLGTVVGMIITFHQIAATGGADKAKLAGGIGLALFTTAGGLIVAIPAILGNRYFASRLTALADQAEAAISRINYRHAHAAAHGRGKGDK